MMRARGFRVVGLDFSRDAAAIAWRRQQVPAVCGVLEHAPLRPGGFAAITMFHVLEHVHDPRAYRRRGAPPTGAGRPADRAGAQRRLLAVPPARPRLERLDVPRHLFDFRDRDVERLLESVRFRGAPPQILFAARQSRGPWPAAWRPRSTPWRGACAACRKAPPRASPRTWCISRWWWPRCRSPLVEAACRRRLDGHDRGPQAMRYSGLAYRLPGPLRRHILHFEAEIEDAVAALARSLPPGARVLDAGAGEGQYAHHFAAAALLRRGPGGGRRRLGLQPSRRHRRSDGAARSATRTFDAALNIVTLEHLAEARARAGRNRPRARPRRAPAGRRAAGMGNPPGAARLLPLHPLRPALPAATGRFRTRRNARPRRLFPPARAAAAQRPTILCRRHSLARLHSRRPSCWSRLR